MIALASAIALENEYRCILTEAHFKLNKLEAYLIGSREYSQEIFIDVGIDGLARSIKLAPLDKGIIENYSIPFLNNKLSLLPGTSIDNKAIYMDFMKTSINRILEEMKEHYDLVFIDLNSGLDEISKLVIDQADIVVVNLNQNKNILDDYFHKQYINKKNIIYLLGGYHKGSSYNIHNLKLKYRQLSKAPTFVIPHCTEFMDAQSDGLVIDFMKRNINNPKESNKYFIDNVKRASRKLVRLAKARKVAT